MPSIKGLWIWKDELIVPSNRITQSVNFALFGKKGIGIVIKSSLDNLHFRVYSFDETTGKYSITITNPIGYYYTATETAPIGWLYDAYKIIDFGNIEQDVSQEFFDYFTENAVYQGVSKVPNVKVMYGNTEISSTDIQSTTLSYKGKLMESDVVIGAHILPTLTAPTISIDGDTLSIQDEEGLATSFDILVDGEVKRSISAGYTVGVYLYTSMGWMSTPTFEYSTDNGNTWTSVSLVYDETVEINGIEGQFKYRVTPDNGVLWVDEGGAIIHSGYGTYTSPNKTLTSNLTINIDTGD